MWPETEGSLCVFEHDSGRWTVVSQAWRVVVGARELDALVAVALAVSDH
jgi:hypothetical protein